jgi:hypothetical protein
VGAVSFSPGQRFYRIKTIKSDSRLLHNDKLLGVCKILWLKLIPYEKNRH